MRATVCDVGPRDGLQNEPETLAPGVHAELLRRLAAAGVPRIEAVSFVHPDRSLCSRNTSSIVGGHFHETRNTGVASSTGNVATEDVLYLLQREGVETGIDLEAVLATAHWLEQVLDRELPGRVTRAGAFPTR